MKKTDEAKKLMQEFNSNSIPDFQLITIVIENPDLIKFNEACNELYRAYLPESFFSWNVQTIPIAIGHQQAFLFVLTAQIWVDESEAKSWLEKIKTKSLIIKP